MADVPQGTRRGYADRNALRARAKDRHDARARAAIRSAAAAAFDNIRKRAYTSSSLGISIALRVTSLLRLFCPPSDRQVTHPDKLKLAKSVENCSLCPECQNLELFSSTANGLA